MSSADKMMKKSNSKHSNFSIFVQYFYYFVTTINIKYHLDEVVYKVTGKKCKQIVRNFPVWTGIRGVYSQTNEDSTITHFHCKNTQLYTNVGLDRNNGSNNLHIYTYVQVGGLAVC